MSSTRLKASFAAFLDWQYDDGVPRVSALYERAKLEQWNADIDIDWSIQVRYGSPLPDGSPTAYNSYLESRLGHYGRQFWDQFRWEFQTWMVSQFLHGEQGALLAAARMVETAGDVGTKQAAAMQVVDEARHVEAFSRYLEVTPASLYPVSPALERLLLDTCQDSRWDIVMLGTQVLVEAVALASFRLAGETFHDDLIKSIVRRVARDEVRHVGLGMVSLGEVFGQLSAAERHEREDFVLAAAELISRRFLMREVWERLGVDAGHGEEFARESSEMRHFRQAVFTKVIMCLSHLGLLTGRVTAGLDQIGLLGAAGRRL
jgi:hypothetical protein